MNVISNFDEVIEFGKCAFCNEDAVCFYYKHTCLTFRSRMLCEDHRIMLNSGRLKI